MIDPLPPFPLFTNYKKKYPLLLIKKREKYGKKKLVNKKNVSKFTYYTLKYFYYNKK